MTSSSVIAFAILFVGVTLSLPLKNNEVEDFVLRANELNRFSPYSDNGLSDMLEKGRLRGRHINPLLYDYYLNALEAAYGRHGDDRSAEIADRREMIKKNFDEIDRTGFKHLKRNFDEIDRVGFGELKRNI